MNRKRYLVAYKICTRIYIAKYKSKRNIEKKDNNRQYNFWRELSRKLGNRLANSDKLLLYMQISYIYVQINHISIL